MRTYAIFLTLFAVLVGACSSEPYVEPRQIDDPLDLPPPEDALEASIRERVPTEAMLMIPHESVVRDQLEERGRRDFTSVLRAGLCYKVLAQGDENVQDLDILVYDPENVLLQRDATLHNHPMIGIPRAICPMEPGLFRIELRMARGRGAYAAQIWVSQ